MYIEILSRTVFMDGKLDVLAPVVSKGTAASIFFSP